MNYVDTKNNLRWIVGPDIDTNYNAAKAFVKWMGPGWRFPTVEELKTLYQKDVGTRNIDPTFAPFSGWFVWCSPRGSSSAWPFRFSFGAEYWYDRDGANDARVFAVMDNMPNEVMTAEDYKDDQEHELKRLFREAVKGRSCLKNLIHNLLDEYTVYDEEDVDTLADAIHGAFLCREEEYSFRLKLQAKQKEDTGYELR